MRKQGSERIGGPVGEEHKPDLGIQNVHVMGTVILFVGPGELVLRDGTGVVLGHRCCREHPHLRVGAHRLTVEVVRGSRIFDKNALRYKAVEVLARFGVGRIAVCVRPLREIDF